MKFNVNSTKTAFNPVLVLLTPNLLKQHILAAKMWGMMPEKGLKAVSAIISPIL